MGPTSRFITLTAAALFVSTAAASFANAETDEERFYRIRGERAAAIQALYGVGLSVKADKGGVSIDWGSLDAATYQRYVAEHYLPELKNWHSKLVTESMVTFSETRIYYKKLGAHALIEPLEKLALCERLVMGLGQDYAVREKWTDFCREQALRHVSAPVIAFRGKAVRYDKPRTYVGAKLDEPLFSGGAGSRDVLITLPGPGSLDSWRGYRASQWIANGVRHDAPARLKRLANETKEKASRGLELAKRRIAKRDKRFAKRRGNIVFTDTIVEGWDPIDPIGKKAKPRCWDSYAQIYLPRRNGYYDLTIKANGKQCSNNVESNGTIKRRSLFGECRKRLVAGANKIEVVIAKNITKKLGKRWNKRELRKQTIYSNRAGKVVLRGRLTCSK